MFAARRERVQDGEVEAIEVSDHDPSLQLVSGLGAKISSLRWRGREILARNPRKSLQYGLYGAPYSAYDASGFDECFPTIGACPYPDAPYAGMPVPDHGELWSIPWKEADSRGGLYHFADGIRFPYRFHRWIDIPGPGQLHLRYQVDNSAQAPFKCFWSAHPLLALRPGMRIHLPDGAHIRVDWSKGDRLGSLLDEHPWPLSADLSGVTVDLSQILPESVGLVDKLYTTRLTEGWCALHDPEDGFYVAMLFSPDQIPYVGLSVNLGGWPVDEPGYYNLGLEPCNGYPDRLDVAAERGACLTLPPGTSHVWDWRMYIGQTDNVRAEIRRLEKLEG